MSITSVVVLYSVIWFMTLFMVLPLFVKSQDENGDVEPGTSAGAPAESMMRRKLKWTTIAATIVFFIVAGIIQSGVITVSDIASLSGQD
jgi:predicted secreted protein